MAKIVAARAWCNNEVAYLAWKTDEKIKDCLGFMITRIHLDAQGNEVERRILPAWAAFKTQSNPDWVERDTSVWPIQKFTWRDLTLRRSRDTLAVRPAGFKVKYEIVPVGRAGPGRAPVPPSPMPAPGTYVGDPVPLFICGDSAVTDVIDVTTSVIGDLDNPLVTAGFTNGILSTQNLRKQLQVKKGQAPSKKQLEAHIDTAKDDPIRNFLSGDALRLVRDYMARDRDSCDLYLALYELNDPELIKLIEDNKDRVHLILSTAGSSKPKKGSGQKPKWDTTNVKSRAELRGQVKEFHDRMFNNSAHIGHNKFAVLVEPGNPPKAKAVLTGSTNWTFTGLCTQSNNVIIVNDPGVADAYLTYWMHLRDDDQSVPVSDLQLPNNHAQGPQLRTDDMTPVPLALGNAASGQIWYSPNTQSKTKKDVTPPDLKVAFDLMDHAEKAIFFLTFKPSLGGDRSIISEAINAAVARPADKALLVLGAISDGTALPGQDAPAKPKTPVKTTKPTAKTGSAAKTRTKKKTSTKKKKPRAKPKSKKRKTVPMAKRAAVVRSAKPKGKVAAASSKSKQPTPKRAIYTNPKAPKVLMIRAAAIMDFDLVGDWEHEMLKYGQAIIHDKIVVIDPLSDNCTVITGSHNLGYKASYANDENMLIIRGNKALAAAYAVHVLDVYDHYKWRAILEERALKGEKPQRGHGILNVDDSWQNGYFDGSKGQEQEYFLGG
jgi:hypothetical protein